ncbi:MAG TPA: Ig-like domain-containing protein [Longimicrobium sp.]
MPATPVSTVLQCTAEVQPRLVSCTSASPAGGVAGDLLLGGQNVNVKLRSSNVQLSGGVLSADVTVQNLLPRAMGTTDGVTPSPAGTRVFFASGPTVTAGSGTATVANADGTGAFTAAGQKYFQYDGILAPGATSGAKSWQFQLSAGVTQFVFTVYVSTALPGENGYIRLDPFNSRVAPGGTKFLSSWIVSAAGTESQSSSLTWTSSDTTVATVSGGTVTAKAEGTAVITASDGVRSGTATITVGPVDTSAPTLSAFSFTPGTVAAGDSVTFTMSASDAGTGMRLAQVQLTSPGGASMRLCSATTPASGTPAAGSYACRITIPVGAEAGTWTVSSVQLVDHAGKVLQLLTASLAARHYATTIAVSDPAPDATAPSLNGFTLSPAPVTAGDSVTATFTTADAGSGVETAIVTLYNAASDRGVTCATSTPATGTAASGTFQCRMGISSGAANGTWAVTSLQVTDRAGNNTSFTAAQLAGRGFTSSVAVSGGTNDTNKPTLTSFSVTPAATSADSVTVTVGVADPGSGAGTIYAEIRSPVSSETITCQSAAPVMGTRANGTFACKAGFPAGAPAGTWTVNHLELTDTAGNQRVYAAGDLQAFGYTPTVTLLP